MNEIDKQAPLNSDKVRFIIVGVINTALDFLLFNLLMRTVLPNAIIANTISTTIAMVFSFFVNKKWTFQDAGDQYVKQVVLFFVFTLFGLYVIQNSLIILIKNTIPHFGIDEQLFLNIAKLAASVGSMTWNYFTYKYFVFKK